MILTLNQQIEETVSETTDDTDNAAMANNNIELTKKGIVRKREKYEVNVNNRKTTKKEAKIMTKYTVKTGCCENQCICKINVYSAFYRKFCIDINRGLWKMSWKEQKHFFLCNSSQIKPARPKIRRDDIILEVKSYIR